MLETSAAEARSGRLAPPLVAAAIAATCLVAQHVVGKAARDALFLSHWPASRLPWVMTASAVLSGPTVGLLGRLIARYGPARVVPPAFAVHAAILTLEWVLG